MRSSDPVSLELVTQDFLSKVSVRDRPHALKYLESVDIDKPQYNRMIAWMVQLGLLPQKPNEWANTLTEMVTSYNCLVEEKCDGWGLERFQKALTPIIPRDLERSMGLCDEIYQVLGISEELLDRRALRMLRAFFLIEKTSEFTYLQGCDRFMYLISAVSTAFCEKVHLNGDAAESFMFYLTKHVLLNVWFGDLVLSPKAADEIYFELDEMLRIHGAATAAALRMQHIKPMLFSLNWLLLLFFEQHQIEDLVIVWDAIFINIDRLQKYVLALVVAHLEQTQIGLDQTATLGRLKAKRDFDVKRLIDNSHRMLTVKPVVVMTEERRGGVPPGLFLLVVALVTLSVGIVLYRHLK